jgi:hypothetical protein
MRKPILPGPFIACLTQVALPDPSRRSAGRGGFGLGMIDCYQDLSCMT